MTVFYGVLDVPSMSMQYASGGHPPLLISRQGEDHVIELQPQATFLGAFDQAEFVSTPFEFQNRDRLLFYTDGIYEGQNEAGNQFGSTRIAELMMENSDQSVQELIELLVINLFEFIGNATLDDDITLLGLEILG